MNTGSQEPPREAHLAVFVPAAIHGIPLTGQLHSFGYQCAPGIAGHVDTNCAIPEPALSPRSLLITAEGGSERLSARRETRR